MDHKVNRQGQETEGGLKEMQSHTSISCEMTQPFIISKIILVLLSGKQIIGGQGKKQDLVRNLYEGSLMER